MTADWSSDTVPANRPVPPDPASSRDKSGVSAGRFAPGTLLGTRFRIVGRLGAGGMGEVYRADDLDLGQAVALKFLPPEMSKDQAALARLRDEVRLARQIAHPNVCRVYDIGEADGHLFLCMEYVDGEDLASVLRRMGRPSAEKALQIARQLCAGIAAAHDAGILHRDLKPANIMIDGRGRVRVTDFGLAGLTKEFSFAAATAGTPAYMAPEQLEGREVTVRSDVYALGLILYEVFTGKRAFEAASLAELRRVRETSSPAIPSSVVTDLDPAVERVILHCLEHEPRHRPASALAIASALPGGDPLAAALAAGETPSPELLAASGDDGGLRPATAIALLVVTLLGLLLSARFNDSLTLYRISPFDKPPEVLADRAAEIIRKLGYDDPVADRGYGFFVNQARLKHIDDSFPSTERMKRLKSIRPTPIEFWYRQSPQPMTPWQSGERLSMSDPPFVLAGMARATVDARGRLTVFNYMPRQLVESKNESPAAEWRVAFEEAGLDFASFQPADVLWTPMMFADERKAWTGSYADQPETTVRVEAAAFRGRLVYFALIFPYTQPGRMPLPDQRGALEAASQWISLGMTVIAISAGALVARRNLRLGRGDRRGAFRLAMAVFILGMAAWLMGGHHASGPQQFDLFIRAAGRNLFTSGWLWLMYVALEPYARRHWPESLIAWSRIMSGRINNPLIGRAVLMGLAAGVALVVMDHVASLAIERLGQSPEISGASAVAVAARFRDTLAKLIGNIEFLFAPIMALFLIVLVQMLVRRRVLAVIITILFLAVIPNLIRALPASKGAAAYVVIVMTILPFVLGSILLIRVGIPALMLMIFVSDRLSGLPLTLDGSAWYSGASWFVICLLAALTIWAFMTSLGGRSLPRELMPAGSRF